MGVINLGWLIKKLKEIVGILGIISSMAAIELESSIGLSRTASSAVSKVSGAIKLTYAR